MPVVTSGCYKQNERLIGPFIEKVAKESCINALEVERAFTLENIDKLKKML